MKKTMRKIGDRSGIGFATEEPHQANRAKNQQVQSEVDRVNEKIRKEAQMMMEARQIMGSRSGDMLDRLDEYSDRFKDTMKAKFAQSFVSSGEINTAKKEATVTFIKRPDN